MTAVDHGQVTYKKMVDHSRPWSTMVKLDMTMVDHGQIVCDRGRP